MWENDQCQINLYLNMLGIVVKYKLSKIVIETEMKYNKLRAKDTYNRYV